MPITEHLAHLTNLSEGQRKELGHLVDQLDQQTEKLFDQLRGNPLADRIFYTASQLGDHGLIWQLIAAVRALLGSKKHQRNFFRISTSLALESILVNGILKSIFPRTRPETTDPHPLYLRQPITGSFPSGHASAAALASILLQTGKRKSLLTWTLAGIVASSRIYVKIHHASDIIAGATVGYALGKLIKSIWRIK